MAVDPEAATCAAEADMLRRFPKADLHGFGTGFAWAHFLPALEAARRVIEAEATARERQRIRHLAPVRILRLLAAQLAFEDMEIESENIYTLADLLDGDDDA